MHPQLVLDWLIVNIGFSVRKDKLMWAIKMNPKHTPLEAMADRCTWQVPTSNVKITLFCTGLTNNVYLVKDIDKYIECVTYIVSYFGSLFCRNCSK